jgi:hypothetical protein
VLTVEPRGNGWAALVLEKLEGEIKDNSGETSEIYLMGLYGRSRFRRSQNGNGVFK